MLTMWVLVSLLTLTLHDTQGTQVYIAYCLHFSTFSFFVHNYTHMPCDTYFTLSFCGCRGCIRMDWNDSPVHIRGGP